MKFTPIALLAAAVGLSFAQENPNNPVVYNVETYSDKHCKKPIESLKLDYIGKDRPIGCYGDCVPPTHFFYSYKVVGSKNTPKDKYNFLFLSLFQIKDCTSFFLMNYTSFQDGAPYHCLQTGKHAGHALKLEMYGP